MRPTLPTAARLLIALLLALPALPLHAATPLPGADAPRTDWRTALDWPQSCEDDWTASGNGSGISSYPLPNGRQLVEVACTPGAYQGSQLYFLTGTEAPAARLQPLVFPLYEDPGSTPRKPLLKKPGSEVWGTPEFDRAHGRLRVTNRFRGPGDCGIQALYAFAQGKVQLVELRAKRSCDGRGAEHPERWQRVPLRN